MSDSIQTNSAMAGSTATDGSISASAATTTTTTTTRANPPSSGATAASVASASASATMTMTMPPQTQTQDDGVLRLTLQDRVGVRWDESVVDNEGMGRKSSKRCCIFHKPRAFGESSTDTSDYDSDNENGKYNSKKIAHKKLPAKKKLPDHLRFHA